MRWYSFILIFLLGTAFISGQTEQKKKLNWTYIKTNNQLDKIFSGNNGRPALIYKHSTRCSISKGALERFENKWKQDKFNCDLYFVDVIVDRPLSMAIAERSGSIHHSPQALLLIEGKVIYNKTHEKISAKEIMNILKKQ